MEFDTDGSLWITHGYKGIYHINFINNYDSITSLDFFNSNEEGFPGHVSGLAKIDGKLLFTTSKGIFHYSNMDKSFSKYD